MTVAELIAELAKMPGHLPVAAVRLGERYSATGVESASFQGRYAELLLDGDDPR